MILQWSERAKRRAGIVDAWWRANTAYPNLFLDELRERLELLMASPKMGHHYPSTRRREVLRVLMPQTQQYIYYSLDEAKGIIELVTIWGAARARGPKL